MRALLVGLREDQVTVRPLADSYHVATLDNDAQAIFEGSLEFIQDHTEREANIT
jgi:carboxylesterase